MDRGSYSDKQANSEEAEAGEKEAEEPARKRKRMDKRQECIK